jgi:uncharacterized protein (DUF2062 family)
MRGRIREFVKKVAVQGISPHELALTIALGVTIGLTPIVWGGTILCAGLAFFFRLNQPGIQVANYLAFPLQIALFLPFYRLGARIFPWGSSVSVEFNIFRMAMATLKALAAWLLIAPPVAILLYFILLPILTRMLAIRTVPGVE